MTVVRVGGDLDGDVLLGRLPLPLAQFYRRALNAKSPQHRHHNAYYLAEATLKLLACLRIGAALAAGLEPRSHLARSLEALCLPAMGHWVGFLREATLFLRTRPDSALLPLAHTHEKLLDRMVVMDLGLAQVRDRSQSLTGTGMLGWARCAMRLQWNLLDGDGVFHWLDPAAWRERAGGRRT